MQKQSILVRFDEFLDSTIAIQKRRSKMWIREGKQQIEQGLKRGERVWLGESVSHQTLTSGSFSPSFTLASGSMLCCSIRLDC